jgi:hypothetical protein
MDVREKLVELLDIIIQPGQKTFGDIADYLISKGVTVQERGNWVTLTDCANAGVYCSVCHKKVYRHDYALCSRKNKLRYAYCPNCGARMMPQPLKGE